MKKRGMAMVIVMVMITLLTTSATMLYMSSRDAMMIAGNIRVINAAHIAAQSGIQHFNALDLTSVELHELAGLNQGLDLISLTKLGNKTYYRVSIVFSESSQNRFAVISTGQYKSGDKIISEQVVEAHYETVDN